MADLSISDLISDTRSKLWAAKSDIWMAPSEMRNSDFNVADSSLNEYDTTLSWLHSSYHEDEVGKRYRDEIISLREICQKISEKCDKFRDNGNKPSIPKPKCNCCGPCKKCCGKVKSWFKCCKCKCRCSCCDKMKKIGSAFGPFKSEFASIADWKDTSDKIRKDID